ncbi:transposase [Butyrivibrio sp. NC2002]|uniref:transposase n=1 Tax=Butyrivibrio sp. NC2002 TaxID=1410610 RepID=UPI000568ACE9|nr:transposase [Butyrivibrio sp. NC2002]
MARRARSMSESGYMHIIVRGNGKQILFEEYQDYKHFLNRLERYCLETEVKTCTYCLMDNHVHLLVHGEASSIVLLMKKLEVSYSGYFNKKYERVGHLFQNRYLSERIETEKYLLTAFRYILQNPEKAGICKSSEFRWSSYSLYYNPPEYIDLSKIKLLLGDNEHYRRFIAYESDEECLDYNSNKHDDEWAKKELKNCLNISSGTVLQNYSRIDRDAALSRLKDRGLSIRQIERLTGINRNTIQRAK